MTGSPKIAAVVTSIGRGDFYDGSCKQAEAEGGKENLRLIMIPDRKTPAALYAHCRPLSAGLGPISSHPENL
jgi:hypothetical protein